MRRSRSQLFGIIMLFTLLGAAMVCFAGALEDDCCAAIETGSECAAHHCVCHAGFVVPVSSFAAPVTRTISVMLPPAAPNARQSLADIFQPPRA